MKPMQVACVAIILLLSSCSDKYERNLKDILGEWRLEEMSFTNELGEFEMIQNLSSTIHFTDKNLSENFDGNLDKLGQLVVESDTISFIYQFNFSTNSINIEIHRDSIAYKPLYTFGKMQVNDFELIDENKLLFSSNFEVVYPTNEKLINPLYIFVR